MGGGVKVPVVDKSGSYTIYYEGLETPVGLMTFVHCDLHTRWSKNIKHNLQDDFQSLLALRSIPLYCLRHDNKQEKFIRMFGFRYLYEIPEHGVDVYILEIK